VLNDFYIPHVSVKVSAAATSRSRLGSRTSRLGLGPLRLGSRLGLGPLCLGSRLGLGLKGLVYITGEWHVVAMSVVTVMILLNKHS